MTTATTHSSVESLEVQRILTHLCEEHPRLFGDVIEWCESRHDCAQAIVCPDCGARFVVDEDELDELRGWTATMGGALGCGVRWE